MIKTRPNMKGLPAPTRFFLKFYIFFLRGKIFFHSLMGLGDKNLNLCHFKGYGAIAHRSIDIGMQYSYLFENLSKLHLKYAYRVYAKNFPLNSQCFTIEYCYDFALDELFSF